jgi:glyoxylase-like metal-dependent hydrolase (beta-lactamase superfamily II)
VSWAVAGLAALAALATASALALAHRATCAVDPPFPALAELRVFAESRDLPARLAWLDTATQPMPRSLVLDAGRDPRPQEPYEMAHPAFVLSWDDGRRLVVDTGMDRKAALEFGRPMVWLGAGPIEPRRSLAEAAGADLARAPAGGLALLFTHRHVDHVEGVGSLCAALPEDVRLRVFERSAQAELGNYTTRPGRAYLDAASCVERSGLADGPAAGVPGFPGVFVIHAGGHTPDSQVVGAFVGGGRDVRGFLLAGDVANALDGITSDVPKPWAYRTFVVPECEARLQRVRTFLREASERAGFTVLVSHDRRALEASLVTPYE